MIKKLYSVRIDWEEKLQRSYDGNVDAIFRGSYDEKIVAKSEEEEEKIAWEKAHNEFKKNVDSDNVYGYNRHIEITIGNEEKLK